MNLKDAIDRFLEYCELDKNLSQKTVRMYSYYINFFKSWVEKTQKKSAEEIMVGDLDEELIRTYRLHLSREYFNPYKGELDRKTQNYFLVALRSMLRFLIRKGHAVLSPEQVELGKNSDRHIKFLSPEEVEKLLQSPNVKKLRELRDRAILELLFSTGLRVSELLLCFFDRLVFLPSAGFPHGVFGCIPIGCRPSPPPCG
jgi:site-specific recombinase XerD